MFIVELNNGFFVEVSKLELFLRRKEIHKDKKTLIEKEAIVDWGHYNKYDWKGLIKGYLRASAVVGLDGNHMQMEAFLDLLDECNARAINGIIDKINNPIYKEDKDGTSES